MAYAETTKVAVAQTRVEIEALLRKAGAYRILTVDESNEAIVMFMLAERMIRFRLPLDEKANGQVRRALASIAAHRQGQA